MIAEATDSVAAIIDCVPNAIVWTSGASEANSWVLQSIIKKARSAGQKARLILSSIEHDSVLLAAETLRRSETVEIDVIRVLPDGSIDLAHLSRLLERPAHLVALMHSNNETGVIQPVLEATRLAHERGVPVLCDAVQSLGKTDFSMRQLGVDYATFSGHKLGAPKGVGFIALGEKLHATAAGLVPLVHGKQQRAQRGGTENATGVAALARLLKRAHESRSALEKAHGELRSRFESSLKQAVAGTIIHGEQSPRLANTTFVGFDGLDGNAVLTGLDLAGICASSGSACSSGSPEPSHVLLAMGALPHLARSSLRFSMGPETTWAELERVLEVLPALVEKSRKKP